MISLGIDCGTQSIKTIALDSKNGKILATASKNYKLIQGLPPGYAEQDASVWIEALNFTVKKVLKEIGSRKNEVVALGVSGQQHGFVALDKNGKVIRPVKLWCDTSTESQCNQIKKHLKGKSNVIKSLGNDIVPGFTASKILWLKQHEPQNFKKLRHVLLPHDYLNYYLTGQYFMEHGDASGTALMDVKSRMWSKKIVSFIDASLSDYLPPLISSTMAGGTLRRSLASEWGLSPRVLVSAGGGDNMMGAIGTGNLKEGIITASLGTSGTIYAYNASPLVDPAGEIALFCDSTGAWLSLLCTMNVTIATESVCQMFNCNHKSFTENVKKVLPGSDGLTFMPFLQGERTPNLPNARGSYIGLGLNNMTAAHFCRATMEGVTLGMYYGLTRMKQLGINIKEVRLTGGGSKNSVWRQMCADIFQIETVCLKNSEGAALGGAIQGLAVAQNKSCLELSEDLVRIDERTRLIPKNSDVYLKLFKKYEVYLNNLYKNSI